MIRKNGMLIDNFNYQNNKLSFSCDNLFQITSANIKVKIIFQLVE